MQAARACRERWRPSKEKGVVTMPTVRIPMDLAIAATTGAAPLPVPPPMPAWTRHVCDQHRSATTSRTMDFMLCLRCVKAKHLDRSTVPGRQSKLPVPDSIGCVAASVLP